MCVLYWGGLPAGEPTANLPGSLLKLVEHETTHLSNHTLYFMYVYGLQKGSFCCFLYSINISLVPVCLIIIFKKKVFLCMDF